MAGVVQQIHLLHKRALAARSPRVGNESRRTQSVFFTLSHKSLHQMRLSQILLPLFLSALVLPANSATYTAGAAAVDISPAVSAHNWAGTGPYGELIDPLHARALVLGSDTDRVVVITLDITETNEADVADIRRAVSAAIKVPGGNILINASHTHSGPLSAGYRWIGLPAKRKFTDEHLEKWARELPGQCAKAAQAADAARQPVTMSIGRAQVGEWLFNRRPLRPDGQVQSYALPPDPTALPSGLRFGPVDPTATVLNFRDTSGKSVVTLLHLACHAVSVYPTRKGISADWPGAACRQLQEALGGEVLFLQGCAGDIVPARRGLAEAREMGAFIAARATKAAAQGLTVPPAPIRVSSAIVGLPLMPAGALHLRQPNITAEIQVIVLGNLAVVALPGEPLIGLSQTIQKESPFPHTLVLGYSNGDGAQYVGLPGEKVRGGYEMTVVGRATDEAGGIMIAAALRQLRELRAAP
jgi:neutral ceramidase